MPVRLVDAIDADYGVYVAADNNLNPQSSFGRAVLDAADDYSVDAGQLASACRELWQQERDHYRKLSEAIRAARQSTGLTRRQIEGWENAGNDSSTWPHLDTAARSLAIEYPILGLGPVIIYLRALYSNKRGGSCLTYIGTEGAGPTSITPCS